MTSPSLFLVAARRSGTTLLRLILNSHNGIYWEPGWEPIADAIGKDGTTLDVHRLRHIKEGFDIDLLAAKRSSPRISELRDALEAHVDSLLARTGKRIFGATCHINAHRLFSLWPDAKFIHLVRDPRDVAISAITLGWESNHWCAADYWIRAESEWHRLRDELTIDQFVDVKYEELVSAPERELIRLCEFVGVPFSKEMFDYTSESNYGMPDASLAYRWSKKLSPTQAGLVEAKSANLMKACGYELSGPVATPGKLQIAVLKIRNRVATAWRRLLREGITTFVLGFLVNRARCEFLRPTLEVRKKELQDQKIRRAESNYANVSRT